MNSVSPSISPRFFTSHEVAALVQVSPSAVLRWIDAGLLKAFRTPGGHRRVGTPELVDFLRHHEMPVPRELEERILLLAIDDEAGYLSRLGALLQRADARIEVELCESPVDGLLKVGLRRPDVVLLDAYMPGMDGAEVCKRLKAAPETADIAVLAMTGRPSVELEAKFRAAGAAGFLVKPFGAPAVLDHLQALGLSQRRRAR